MKKLTKYFIILLLPLFGCRNKIISIYPSVEFDNSAHEFPIKEVKKDKKTGAENYMFSLKHGGFVSIQSFRSTTDSVDIVKLDYEYNFNNVLNIVSQKNNCEYTDDGQFTEVYKAFLIIHSKIECDSLQFKEFYLCTANDGVDLCAVNIVTSSNHDHFDLTEVYDLLDKITFPLAPVFPQKN